MRKPKFSILFISILMFAAFTLGFLIGRTTHRNAIVVDVPRTMLTAPTRATEEAPDPTVVVPRITFPIDINRADKVMLMELPGIGEVMAERIIAYRTKHGDFTHVEELLNVEGMGTKKLDKIWDLIMIGG